MPQNPPSPQGSPPQGPAPDQSQHIRALSLEEALERAVRVSDAVEIARGDLTQSRGAREVSRADLLPQLTASAGYTRTLRSQFDNLDNQGGPQVPDSNLFSAFGVGRANQYSLGVQLSQLIFDGGAALSGLHAADARLRAAQIGVSSAEAQALLTAIQSYFDASLAGSLVDIAERSLEQAQRVLDQTQLAYRVGDRSEFDLLRARVARDNEEPTVRIRRNERTRALLSLEHLLNLPEGERLRLTTPIENLPARFSVPGDTHPDARAPVRQARETVAATQSQLKQARRQRYPTLQLNSRYAPSAFTSSGLPSSDDVRTDWTVGLSVSMPLYIGGRIGGSEREARGAVQRAQAQLQLTYEGAELDARTSADDLAAAQETFASSSATAQQAERAYRIAELRYRSGLTTLVELLDTRLAWDRALITRAQAARDVQVARARLSLLPLLPLPTQTPAPTSQLSASGGSSSGLGQGATQAATQATMGTGASSPGTSGATPAVGPAQ